MPEMWRRADLAIIRALLSIVVVGFVLVAFALLLLRWPTPAGDQAVQQMTRMAGSDNNSANLMQRLPDLAIYLILLAGIAFLALALRRGDRSLLVGLMGVGFLGLAYAAGMALYIGPMVSVCGFMLILFGGMVTWATTGASEEDAAEAAPEGGQVPDGAEMHTLFEMPEQHETGENPSGDDQAPDDMSPSE